jgi:hypothetical protein
MTHPIDVVTQSLELAGHGLSASEVARRVGVPRATVRDWLAGRVPARVPAHYGTTPGACGACGGVHDLDALPASYVYLLGMYLGDGCLSAHPRGVFKLRISLDARYPGIAEECERAIRAVMPRNRIGYVGYGTWRELFTYSKSWPCLFPQHGPGRKHEHSFANVSEDIKGIVSSVRRPRCKRGRLLLSHAGIRTGGTARRRRRRPTF